MFYSSDFAVIGMSMLALAGFIWYAVGIVVRQGKQSQDPAVQRQPKASADTEH